MDDSLTERKKELFSKLSDSVRWSKKKRLARFAKHPLKMLRILGLRMANKSKEVNLRTFWGGEMRIIFPERVSILILKHGYFEADVCLYMIAFLEKGMTFIDIGSHFGFFTLFASYLVQEKGRVLAFEPSPKICYQLQQNITSCCKYANAEAYNYAAYSKNDKMRFYDYGLEDSSFNSIFGTRDRNNPSMLKNEIIVQAKKIDDILTSKEIKKVDVVKIDAESSEIHVLAGCRQTLKFCKPKIILEVGDCGVRGVPKSKEIITYLQQMDYSPYEVRKGEIVPHILRDTYEYGNLLFINNKCRK